MTKADEETKINKDESIQIKLLRIVKDCGFKILLGWHYLVLFSPVFLQTSDVGFKTEYLFNRQFVIYVALAFAFFVLSTIERMLCKQGKNPTHRWIVVAAAIIACAVSLVLSIVSELGILITILLLIMLAFCEAVLMFTWLRLFVIWRSGRAVVNFAMDMIFGGFIAFIVMNLTFPIGSIVASALPVLACGSFLVNVYGVGKKPSKKVFDKALEPIIRHNVKSKATIKRFTIPVFYACALAFAQGVFFENEVPLFVSNSPFMFLGVVFAGFIFYFLSESKSVFSRIDLIHRYSLVLLVVGIGFLLVCGTGYLSDNAFWAAIMMAEIFILAGFNLADFDGLIGEIRSCNDSKAESFTLIDNSRSTVYLALTVGLVAGHYSLDIFKSISVDFATVLLCCCALVFVVCTVLFYDRDFAVKAELAAVGAAREKILKQTGEVYSTFPSKDMPSVLYMSNPFDAEIQENLKQNKKSREGGEGEGQSAAPKRGSWHEACEAVIKRYGLTARESEIFFVVAKGRNAEYVQQEFVISINTAKTHIANIYRKLDVHSLQELLDLVETFRKDLD